MDQDGEQRIESWIADWLTDSEIPGASVAIIDGPDLVYAEGFGARDLETNAPATPDTLYGIGSCTKSVTAVALLKLAADGRLDLDDPVDDYVPYLADVPGPQIRIEQLLTHTSGMPSDGNLSALITRLTDIGDATVPLTSSDDFRRHVQDSAEERYTAGDRFFYYNTGYALLGEIIATVRGTDYPGVVEESILAPLGMDRSCFDRERFEAEPDRMTAYYRADGALQAGRLGFAEPLAAPGGLVSSVTEASRYLRMLRGGGTFDGNRILSEEYVDMMVEPRVGRYETIDGVERTYGYGLSRQEYLGDTLIGHGGMMGTTTAYLGWLDEADVGVVVACNTAPENHPTVAGHAVLALLEGEDPDRVVAKLALEATAAELEGTYESYRGIKSAAVDRDGTTLTVSFDGRFDDTEHTLLPLTSDPDDLRYETVIGDKRVVVEFVRTDGGVDMLFQRWRLHRT